ncbi:MAG: ABC transporter permease, partial [Candidatus Acidiferrales bacterium]
MFGRIVWKMLRGGKGRTLVALLAITSGAAVISALLNVQFDMQHKLAEEFRTLGANIVIAPQSGAQTASLGNSANSGLASSATPVLLNADVIEAGLKNNRTSDVVASAPFLFVVVRANETPVVVAGTWLDQLPGLNPTWKLEGSWVASRDDRSQCLIGRSVAKQLGLTPAGQITLAYLGRTAALRVAGILDSGAAEDDQVFVDLPVAQTLAGTPGGIGLWQL